MPLNARTICAIVIAGLTGANPCAAAIALSDVANLSVLQRNLGDARRTVTVSGTYSGSTINHIEARVVEEIRDTAETVFVDWNNARVRHNVYVPLTNWTVMTMAAGTYSGDVAVPDGGWYLLQVRSRTTANSTVDSVMGSNRWRVRTFFENYQVVQRNIGGTSALVAVSGTHQLAGVDRIQARVVDHGTTNAVVGWTTIDASPGANTFSGTLTVPQGGWYNLHVRARDASNATLALEQDADKWGVGVVVLCIGQSNMSGGGYQYGFTVANDLAACYSNDNEWEHLQDPYEHGGRYPDDIDKQWWGDGSGASCVPALANALTGFYQIPFAFVPCARGGTPLHYTGDQPEWISRTSSDHDDIGNLYGNSVYNAGQTGGAELIVMWQGETDADHHIGEQTYYNDLLTLHQHYQEDIHSTIPLFIVQIGQTTYPQDIASFMTGIRSAQLHADNGQDLLLGASAIDMTLGPGDQWHPRNPQYDTMGLRLGHAIKYYYGDVPYYRGPRIASAAFDRFRRDRVRVTLRHSGGTDIAPSRGITGFEVLDNGTSASIDSVNRLAPDTLVIYLSEEIADSGTVRYLYGRAPDVSGAVKDNSGLSLPLEPTTSEVPVGTISAIEVLSPNGGETWPAASTRQIAWRATHGVDSVGVFFSADSGVTWVGVGKLAVDDSPWAWTAPDSLSRKCLIRIEDAADGQPGDLSDAVFTIAQGNMPPGDILLSSAEIGDDVDSGAVVGLFSTVDPDTGDSHIYAFAAGAGDEDNGAFGLDGSALKTAGAVDFEAKSGYSVRVRSTDSGDPNLWLEEVFVIVVTNVNDKPSIDSASPQGDTVALPLDTAINFEAYVSDPDTPDSSLARGWILDSVAVAMPCDITKEGRQVLRYFVWDGEADTVWHAWTLGVSMRVLGVGDTLITDVPLSTGLLRVRDSAGTRLALEFPGMGPSVPTVSLSFLPSAFCLPGGGSVACLWVDGGGDSLLVRIGNDTLTDQYTIAYLDTIDQWLVCSSYVDTVLGEISAVAGESGTYTVADTAAFRTFTAPLRAGGFPRDLSLWVFPMPVREVARLRIGIPLALEGAILRVDMVNLNGRVIRVVAARKVQAGWLTAMCDLDGIAPGTYVCRLRAGNRVLQKKCLIAK
jgi:hypothetical protein